MPGLGSIQPAAGYIANSFPLLTNINSLADTVVDRAVYKIKPQWGASLQLIKRFRQVTMPQLGADRKIYYGFKKMLPRYDVVSTGGATAAITAIPVAHGEYFGRQELWMNERTLEIFRVDEKYTDATPDSLGTVTRAFGTVAAQPMLAGDVLVRLTFVGAEFGRMADSVYAVTQMDYNYPFESRASVGASDWAMMTKMLMNEDVWDDDMAQALTKIKEDQVAQLLFGQRKSSSTDQTDANWISGRAGATAPQYACDGFVETMRRNGPADTCIDVDGTLTGATFMDILMDRWMFRGSNQRALGVGQKGFKLVQKIKYGKLDLLVDNENMNLQLWDWQVNGKRIVIVYDSACDMPDVGTPTRGEMMFGFDFGSEGGQDFSPRIVQIQANKYSGVQPTEGETGDLGQIIGMHSFLNPHPECQQFIEGITDVTA